MKELFGEPIKKLGFGLMRLPKKGVNIDIEQVKQMVDMFMDAGFTYFDTARVYPGSETAAKKALVDRKPRDSYQLATKLYGAVMPTAAAAKKQTVTSLRKTDAGYFDCYLLHALMRGNYKRYEKLGLWDYAKELKKKGLVKHIGFSYHSDPELLDEILAAHPEAEFVQLQINYADWERKTVASRRNYEVARKYDKPIIIMEPVKGGSLANPPAEVKKMFKECRPDMSYASWAIRFAASLPGVLTVLSGMSNLEQMKDNLSFMTDFKPLDDEERAVIREAMKIMGNSPLIPCTSCGYCLEGCPEHIHIPEIFTAMNTRLEGQAEKADDEYRKAVSGGSRAASCIECRKCEKACPQQIEITKHLKEASKIWDNSDSV